MKLAARVGDLHTCPGPGPIPHVGGLIAGPGVTTVSIDHQHAATVSTPCTCAVPAGNVISGGSGTVSIGYLPAARAGDSTSHGGRLTGGCPTVLIGD